MSRVAVVTGAAGGIGLGVAQRLAADGVAVALIDRDGPRVTEAAAALAAEGHEVKGYELDVSDRAATAAVYDAVRADLGGPITIVVTSAGIEGFTDVASITDEEWDRVIAVNLTGTFIGVQLALPDMFEAGWGRIVTISSSSALSGAPRMAHYTASKGGVIGLTRTFARELASKGITANSVAPSIVDTPMARHASEEGNVPAIDMMAKMVPAGRAGTPADIAGACAYLASEEAAYVTGQVIVVAGGMHI